MGCRGFRRSTNSLAWPSLASTATPVLPARGQAGWSRADLVRRVVRALDFARDAIGPARHEPRLAEMGLPRERFVAENGAPAVLRFPDRAARSPDRDARSDEIRAAICLDPGQALDHAFAHILLGPIGYRDAAMEELLAESLTFEAAPERLPHRLLEQCWLRGLSHRATGVRQEIAIPIEGSILARPVDVPRVTRFDHYGFTHAVMYASDFGAAPSLPDPAGTADANAVTALAFALETVDYDLAAEVLLTWPLLRLAWLPAAGIAFEWLARAEDKRGFLTARASILAWAARSTRVCGRNPGRSMCNRSAAGRTRRTISRATSTTLPHQPPAGAPCG